MRAQDEAEFTDLVTAVSPRLLRTAYAVCGDRHLAEDAVQSALASAYRSWRLVKGADSREAYLRKMVVNELLGRRRRKSWALASPRASAHEPSHVSHEADVVERDRVWSAVAGLPPRQRAVVGLRFYEGMSEAEIAEALGIRPGTVKSQAAAAMAHLRRTLGEDPEGSRPRRGTREGRTT
jgi:RNA polymerase sigma-70 factor (sigma-E family)